MEHINPQIHENLGTTKRLNREAKYNKIYPGT